MENEIPKCPICQGEMKIVPAGVSKSSGKPYNAFYACKTWECKGTAKMATESPKTSPSATQSFTGSYRPTKEAMTQRKEMFNVIEHKAENIRQAQAHKDSSMTTLAINRDATLITVACLNGSTMLMAKNEERQEFIKKELKYWREYLQNSVYNLPF